MATNFPLTGTTILVTRPKKQAIAITKVLVEKGAEIVLMPMIEIVSVSDKVLDEKIIVEQDMIIFVSRNAVTHFKAGIMFKLSSRTRLVAIGSATARCMEEKGLRVDMIGPTPAGSESLLALPEMQTVVGLKVMIIRGESGRELLADTLKMRGANIRYLELYKRCLPNYKAEEITRAQMVDTIIVTSVTGLENLCHLISNHMIKHKLLIVVSERIKQVAIKLGFQHIAVTDDVSNTAILDCVVENRTR
jgi:uroporphyrinogen-III synthase